MENQITEQPQQAESPLIAQINDCELLYTEKQYELAVEVNGKTLAMRAAVNSKQGLKSVQENSDTTRHWDGLSKQEKQVVLSAVYDHFNSPES